MNRLKDNSDVPGLEPCQKTYTSSKRKTKLHSTRPRKDGYSHSGACMHIVSKRDFNSAELEIMRTLRSPTTVVTANDEVQTREAAVYVRELDYS